MRTGACPLGLTGRRTPLKEPATVSAAHSASKTPLKRNGSVNWLLSPRTPGSLFLFKGTGVASGLQGARLPLASPCCRWTAPLVEALGSSSMPPRHWPRTPRARLPHGCINPGS